MPIAWVKASPVVVSTSDAAREGSCAAIALAAPIEFSAAACAAVGRASREPESPTSLE